MTRCIGMLALICAAATGPALAAGAPTAVPSPAPVASAQPKPVKLANPWLAAGLSLGCSALLVGSGAGQFYAGDWGRGILVGLGEPAAILVPIVPAFLVVFAAVPNADLCVKLSGTAFQCDTDPNRIIFTTMGVCWGAYCLWAAWDAYHVAEAHNRALLPPPGPR